MKKNFGYRNLEFEISSVYGPVGISLLTKKTKQNKTEGPGLLDV